MHFMKHSDYPIRSIPFKEVEIKDQFWSHRIKNHREITLPHVLNECEKTHRIDNFAIAGGLKNKGKISRYPFDDSDVYKIIEGAANALKIHQDSELEKKIDDIIDKIVAAQEEDGYLYTHRTINPENPPPWAGKKRWELVSIFSHELYCVGHLYESAVAYYEATGKRKLLDIAIKNADLVENEFGPGKIEIPDGHQEIEIGLVKLFRVTSNEKYLNLAKFFLDIRGDKQRKGYQEYFEKSIDKLPWKGEDRFKYNQTHAKINEQVEAIGHALRALYMYSAMMDIGVLTNSKEYIKTSERLWNDIVYRKMYITGGIGNHSDGEAIGQAYKLPNLEAYNETCAAVASILWNHRLFLLHGNSKYVDVLERTLYNGLLSGYSLDGHHFFYSNPLYSDGKHKRNPWYIVACCPSNITRFIPSISGFIYALREKTLYINLYIKCNTSFSINGTSITITQETDYPWTGHVKFILNTQKKSEFKLALRIPCWTQNKPLPSDLYQYLENSDQKIIIKVNGKNIHFSIDEGYAVLSREWENRDEIELLMPMLIRRVVSNEKVENNLNKVALERGPLVYCLEWPDNEFPDLKNVVLNDKTELSSEYRKELFNGIIVIKGTINSLKNGEKKFIAIPYYAWAHRGMGEMTVWMNRN